MKKLICLLICVLLIGNLAKDCIVMPPGHQFSVYKKPDKKIDVPVNQLEKYYDVYQTVQDAIVNCKSKNIQILTTDSNWECKKNN